MRNVSAAPGRRLARVPWRRLAVVAAVGLALLGGLWSLPIADADVERLTAVKLARDALAELRPDSQAPQAVRVTVSGPAAAAVRPLVEAPVRFVAGPDGNQAQAAFAAVDHPAAPALSLETRREGAQLSLVARLGEKTSEQSARVGSFTSLLPPLVALLLAIGFRRVLPALLVAVLVGAVVLREGTFFGAVFGALWAEVSSLALAPLAFFGADVTLTGHLGKVVADSFNLQILAFTFVLVGVVGVIGRMGGTQGLVNALSRFARGPRSAQAVTSAMGTALFFDDYANTVVVGTTARSLTDAHRVSREKLAYIVDSTSAPVAGVAVVSTWIGYEVGLFDDLLGTLATVPGMASSGYELFFQIMPLRFYCLFALALVFLNAWTGRDFGAMRRAEQRVRAGGPPALGPRGAETAQSLGKPGAPNRARHALIPIGVVLGVILGWIVVAGSRGLPSFSPLSLDHWKAVFASEAVSDNSATILLGGAVAGAAVAFALALGGRILTVRDTFGAFVGGLRTLFEAAGVLILAWAIKSVCDALGTGLTMVALVDDALPPVLLPLAIFGLSGVVAFSTGTSWGTMALVLPVAAPLSVALSGEPLIVLACLGAVLDGAIFGDHCSPISDTTVLSATATGCPLMDHVRTQLPYALLAMVVAGAVGYYGVVAGLPVWATYLLGIGLLLAGLFAFGRRVAAPPAPSPASQGPR